MRSLLDGRGAIVIGRSGRDVIEGREGKTVTSVPVRETRKALAT
jgi:hypothetical protein